MGLKVLFVASEVAPYAKSGGLGDVAGSLPKALRNAGIDARVVFPKYRTIKDECLTSCEYIKSFDVTLDWRTQKADIFTMHTDVPTYLIGTTLVVLVTMAMAMMMKDLLSSVKLLLNF